MTIYTRTAAHLDAALDALEAAGTLPAGLNRAPITLEPPRDASHGDMATNAAMVLAKPAGTNPRALAEALLPHLTAIDDVSAASIAGPGFINLTLNDAAWRQELLDIAEGGADYGRSAIGGGATVNIEYVSANPTGPMHMGHCRGAVVGDALAALLEFSGHSVVREYYVNDAGGQVDVLARSVYLRYWQSVTGHQGLIPEGVYPGFQVLIENNFDHDYGSYDTPIERALINNRLYPGGYLKPVAESIAAEFGDEFIGVTRV